MARHWVYLPFGDTSKSDPYVKASIDHYERRYGEYGRKEFNDELIIKCGDAVSQPLKNVQPDDLLVIIGHGDRDNRQIIKSRYQVLIGLTDWISKTHDDLAEQLKGEGLSDQHRAIKLWMCFSAAGRLRAHVGEKLIKGKLEPLFDPLTHVPLTKSFADLLAAALGHTHKHIAVGGFLGMTSQSPEIGRHGVTYPNTKNPSANYSDPDNVVTIEKTQRHVVWFGPDGFPVARPPLPPPRE